MERREEQRAKIEPDDDDQNDNYASKFVVVLSSDDEEAKEDLSLKIVEKALFKRAAKMAPNNAILDYGWDLGLVASSSRERELVVVLGANVFGEPSGIGSSELVEVGGNGEVKTERKKKKKKMKKAESSEPSVMVDPQRMVGTVKPTENNEFGEAGTMHMGNNIVLRKLLRGPRYFDPPDIGWETCYNCGEEGHAAVNCTAAKRKKPCFVCGSLEHKSKQCLKTRYCFICKKGGHRAKDCPEKQKGGSKSSMICLKCGHSGHDIFSCKGIYLWDDLKEIQCFVCKRFGHLCCVSSDHAPRREVSCYKCGQLGHTGLACSRLRGKTAGAATPSSCHKCGGGGHFAHECTSSANVRKRNGELLNRRTPVPKFRKNKDCMGHRSALHDISKKRRKKKFLTEERGLTTPQKSKHRGVWTTEDPGHLSRKRSKKNSWRSPAIPSNKSTRFSSFSGESHVTGPRSQKTCEGHAGNPKSQGSAIGFHHGFSASRFGKSSSDGQKRTYDW